MPYQQAPPFCVQIELVEGCNLRCGFCGLNGIRGKDNDFKYLTPETAEEIAGAMAELKWNARVEFAMHGEPSAHPDYLQIIEIFRTHLPRAYLMMESNGYGFVKDPLHTIVDIFDAGLNCLALDEYEGINLVPKIKKGLYPGTEDGTELCDIRVHYYPKDTRGNPHQREMKKRLTFISPLNKSTTGTHATVNNHCGCGSPKNDNGKDKRCAKPFRELSFRWDGSVAVCCNDWRGTLAIGNIHEDGLTNIWQSPRMEAARKKLYHGLRDFGPCLGCDAVSYRPGLLPDHLGKLELEKPDEHECLLLELAAKEKSLTQPILRPWELKKKRRTNK